MKRGERGGSANEWGWIWEIDCVGGGGCGGGGCIIRKRSVRWGRGSGEVLWRSGTVQVKGSGGAWIEESDVSGRLWRVWFGDWGSVWWERFSSRREGESYLVEWVRGGGSPGDMPLCSHQQGIIMINTNEGRGSNTLEGTEQMVRQINFGNSAAFSTMEHQSICVGKKSKTHLLDYN
jgi:hypothetical protein